MIASFNTEQKQEIFSEMCQLCAIDIEYETTFQNRIKYCYEMCCWCKMLEIKYILCSWQSAIDDVVADELSKVLNHQLNWNSVLLNI